MSSTETELVYFAWVRERIGKDRESYALPDEIETPAQLIAHLAERGDGYAHAFENPAVVRIAVDKKVVDADLPLTGAREIAFFPPMTGG